MLDTNDYKRRADDLTDSGSKPNCHDAWALCRLLQDHCNKFEARITALERAFVKDDLGNPDIEGHRKAHLALIEASKVVDSYKSEATKKMIGWAVAAMVAGLVAGFVSYLKDHLK